MSLDDPSSVAVALRVRPLVQSELDRGCRIAVERSEDGSPQVTVNRTESYTYNHVFDIGDSQKDLFETCVKSKLKRLLAGYNVTILAYGQTGSGKTYTMGTAFNGVLDDHVGVIPRAVHDIFQAIEEMREEFRFSVTCSFVELYQEQFYDLFSSQKRDKATVDIREVKNRVVMPGLTELEVKSAQEVTDHLMRGSAGRAVAATAMNESSSRSHAIFTVTLVANKLDGKQSVTTSRFNLVDLAGSERCSKTLASGDRFKEGVNINKGLLALGNVINALGSGQAAGYIPYRQSKLTRLLQDSLGGNSITLMIACVSPADYNVAETLSTLRYADRALQIKNKPVVNLDPHAAEVNMLKDIIQKLRVELLAGGKMTNSISSAFGAAGLGAIPNEESLAGSMASVEENKRLKEQVRILLEKNRKLQQELHHSLADLTEKEMRAHIAEQAHDKLRTHVMQLKNKVEPQQKSGDGDDGDQQLREISELVQLVDDELQRTQAELETQGQETRQQLSDRSHSEREENSGSSGSDEHEMLQSNSEEFTNKQLNFAGELRNINRQLDLKQELHERIIRNFSKLDEEDGDAKLRQCNQKIDDLEAERRDLMDQLRNIKNKDTSAKIAEERRKRLQLLEQEISELRRKLITQANMLKMREKEREKIQNLSSEIRSMKESKVKLIRAMRGESEKFRQWKMQREKELTQLKSKDRKMQSEIVRQQALHLKQRQVMKRKCEEALATNKRLKDALDRQALAQAQRHKYAKDHGGSAAGSSHSHPKTDCWVDSELEIILSLIDAEHSLEQLMDDRAVINNHYHQLQQEKTNDPVEAKEKACLLTNFEEELEMRNAQIADLQQKVCPTDLDSRIRSLAEGVQSIGESRAVSKQLLKTLVQQRRQQAASLNEQRTMLDELRTQLMDAQQQQEAINKRLRLAQTEHEEQMLAQQRAYEEKVAVLIRTASQRAAETQPPTAAEHQRQQILEELLSSKEALQMELDKLKAKSKSKEKAEKAELQDLDDSVQIVEVEESIVLSDISDDPDWVPTRPISKKNRANSSRNESIGQDANGTSADNASMHSLNSTTATEDGKRGKGCKCRTKCNTKRCGCFVNSTGCCESCICKRNCFNPINAKAQLPEGGDGDGHPAMEVKEGAEDVDIGRSAEDEHQPTKENAQIFATPETPHKIGSPKRLLDTKTTATPLSNLNGVDDFNGPKLARMSGLTFATPKRKFF
ncbi:chromosome-associated kinesin KIF4 isoform X2 [Drosophila ficusphila]|uniref:chromosome-associated kinesin KIF4 isoform X2 n=1 Tax=Drosophila ficusphila TaxID=30025 RepID=UPI001C8AC226|nr:chromosome-associated kinesin KIF4 isoform X2 [Drosophila ficusphila]